ncbi:MAG: hypothetical protein ABIF77_14665 [bacterium]
MALDLYRKTIESDEVDTASLKNMARVFEGKGDRLAAMDAYQKALDVSGGDPESAFLVSLIENGLGRVPDLATLNLAYSFRKDDPRINAALEQRLQEREILSEDECTLVMALAKDRTIALPLQRLLAASLLALGREADAELVLRDFLARGGEDPGFFQAMFESLDKPESAQNHSRVEVLTTLLEKLRLFFPHERKYLVRLAWYSNILGEKERLDGVARILFRTYAGPEDSSDGLVTDMLEVLTEYVSRRYTEQGLSGLDTKMKQVCVDAVSIGIKIDEALLGELGLDAASREDWISTEALLGALFEQEGAAPEHLHSLTRSLLKQGKGLARNGMGEILSGSLRHVADDSEVLAAVQDYLSTVGVWTQVESDLARRLLNSGYREVSLLVPLFEYLRCSGETEDSARAEKLVDEYLEIASGGLAWFRDVDALCSLSDMLHARKMESEADGALARACELAESDEQKAAVTKTRIRRASKAKDPSAAETLVAELLPAFAENFDVLRELYALAINHHLNSEVERIEGLIQDVAPEEADKIDVKKEMFEFLVDAHRRADALKALKSVEAMLGENPSPEDADWVSGQYRRLRSAFMDDPEIWLGSGDWELRRFRVNDAVRLYHHISSRSGETEQLVDRFTRVKRENDNQVSGFYSSITDLVADYHIAKFNLERSDLEKSHEMIEESVGKYRSLDEEENSELDTRFPSFWVDLRALRKDVIWQLSLAHPENLDYKWQLAETYYDQGMFSDAAKLYRDLIDDLPRKGHEERMTKCYFRLLACHRETSLLHVQAGLEFIEDALGDLSDPNNSRIDMNFYAARDLIQEVALGYHYLGLRAEGPRQKDFLGRAVNLYTRISKAGRLPERPWIHDLRGDLVAVLAGGQAAIADPYAKVKGPETDSGPRKPPGEAILPDRWQRLELISDSSAYGRIYKVKDTHLRGTSLPQRS